MTYSPSCSKGPEVGLVITVGVDDGLRPSSIGGGVHVVCEEEA